LLTVIRLSHRDDVAVITARSPHHHDHSFVQVSNGHEPLLTIVEALVGILDQRTVEHLFRIRKIEAVLRERVIPLRRIERNRHEFM
jgi:hypothetical protein